MQVTPGVSQNTAAGQNASANGSGSMINSDFETFLTMLTTQMQNQDPLNPMESTEFASQLATFSGVEQQVRTNDLLVGLQNSMAAQGLGQMADWIGRDVRAAMPVEFDGSPITLAASPHNLADAAILVVTDAEGNEMQRTEIPLSSEPFEWAGTTSDGEPLPNGIYEFRLESFSGEELLDTTHVQSYAEVQEAQVIDGAVWLSLPGGIQLRADNVSGVRA